MEVPVEDTMDEAVDGFTRRPGKGPVETEVEMEPTLERVHRDHLERFECPQGEAPAGWVSNPVSRRSG